jgi:myo-inositol-1-phosphate synthase
MESGIGGALEAPCAYFCKHPPVQYTDDTAYSMVDAFIRANVAASRPVKLPVI